MAKTAADCTTMAEIRENIDRVDQALMALMYVRGAAPVNLPVRNLAAERTVRPLCLVDHIHRIDVPVH